MGAKTMKVRHLVSSAGPNGAVRNMGETQELDVETARSLIEAGFAEPVAVPAVKKAETRSKPRKSGRPKKQG